MIQSHNYSGTAERIFGFILLLPLIAGVWSSAVMAQIIFLIISLLMFYELGKMAALRIQPLIMLVGLSALANLSPFLAANYRWTEQIMLACVIGMVFFSKIGLDRLTSVRQIGDFSSIMIICVASGSALLTIPEGRFWLLALAIVIASCDTAAYFVGRFIGGPRLAPTISPNKTVSGALGGILATLLSTMLLFGPLDVIGRHFSIEGEVVVLSWAQVISGGLVIGVLSQLGDLLESSLKRNLGLKDSSQLIPGHGGVLDRFDGYLLTLPAVVLFFMVV